MIKKTTCAAIIIVAACSLGCTTTATNPISVDSKTSISQMYPIAQDQADKILAQSLAEEFPKSSIVRVELPFKGYQATWRIGFTSHDFTLRMLPAKGTTPDGKIVEGYTFEVLDYGSLMFEVAVIRPGLITRVREKLNAAALPLPVAP